MVKRILLYFSVSFILSNNNLEIDDIKAGEIWCISLSSNGEYLAGTTHDGRINVYSTIKIINGEKDVKIREYETKGSFGMTLDLVRLFLNIFIIWLVLIMNDSH